MSTCKHALGCRTYKRVMEEAAMLGSFIRLVDYMLVEALVDRTIGSVEEIVAMLEAPRASAEKTHKVCNTTQQMGIIGPAHGCSVVSLYFHKVTAKQLAC